MPISGVVITSNPLDMPQVKEFLTGMTGVDMHGEDTQGNIVAVFDTQTAEQMEKLMKQVNSCPFILHAGVTYLNMEDMLEPMSGEGR